MRPSSALLRQLLPLRAQMEGLAASLLVAPASAHLL
jgi:hypothetical protein